MLLLVSAWRWYATTGAQANLDLCQIEGQAHFMRGGAQNSLDIQRGAHAGGDLIDDTFALGQLLGLFE
jgi:hypothetical protein